MLHLNKNVKQLIKLTLTITILKRQNCGNLFLYKNNVKQKKATVTFKEKQFLMYLTPAFCLILDCDNINFSNYK